MHRYNGISSGDAIRGGGSFVSAKGFGHEIFNFRPFRGRVFGYVQPISKDGDWAKGRIDIRKLGANASDTSISDVLVVWVATSPVGHAYVVGWYKNATVHKSWQTPPTDSHRRYRDSECGFFIEAKAEDAILLPPDERVFQIPQRGPGNLGRSNVWFALDPVAGPVVRNAVLEFIESPLDRTTRKERGGVARQPDVLRRQQAERVAVETTTAFFEGLGYTVDSVESQNLGWDLTARLDNRLLRLEVKGLSGKSIAVELTHNEYAAMKRFESSYRLCVVTDALSSPRLQRFAHAGEFGHWESESGAALEINELTAARCRTR